MARSRHNLRSATRIKLEKIARMEILGQSLRQIAAVMGLQPDTIREMIRMPHYAPVDEEIRRRVGETLRRIAPDAAQFLAGLIHSPDEVTARIAATAVLDRIGHGPIRRRAVRQPTELYPASVEVLRDAMREANMARRVYDMLVEEMENPSEPHDPRLESPCQGRGRRFESGFPLHLNLQGVRLDRPRVTARRFVS